MTSQGWAGMNLKVGDTVAFTSLDGKTMKTVTIVGIISVPSSFETLGKVLAPNSLVNALRSATTGNTTVFYMKVAPAQVDAALSTLNRIVPNASVQNLSDSAVSFLQTVNSFMDVLIAIASHPVRHRVAIRVPNWAYRPRTGTLSWLKLNSKAGGKG